MRQPRPGFAFFVLALAFLALGIAGNRTFLSRAVVFFATGVMFMRRPSR